MDSTSLTDEQKKFLEECENEFKDRYTDKDKDFMKIKNAELKKPPIVDPWYNKPRRPPYDWARQNHGHNRRNHHWDRRNNERGERVERHAGKHHLNQRHNSRPY